MPDKNDSEEEEEANQVQKRNPDTEARNPDFVELLKLREAENSKSMMLLNKTRVSEMCTGRSLKPRIDVPEGVEVA